MALLGVLPEVDPAATGLLAALRDLNPVVTALERYQTTREFKEDGFRFAREQQPLLVERMRAAIKASGEFSSVLFERRVEELPVASLAQRLLATSLTTRRLVRRYETLDTAADASAFLAALSDAAASNGVLVATIGALSPKVDSACAGHTQSVDGLIGHGRDTVRSIRADASQPAGLFADAYNRSVRDLSSCWEDEARARS